MMLVGACEEKLLGRGIGRESTHSILLNLNYMLPI